MQEMAHYSKSKTQKVEDDNEVDAPIDLNDLMKHIHIIIKLQSIFRGHMCRRNTSLVLKTRRADSRYFTIEESKETVSGTSKYNPDAKREKRPLYTYKTGATYDGEWIGGFRDGYGV